MGKREGIRLMGTSYEEGKPWIIERIMRTHPRRVLDVGAGCGTYRTLLRLAGYAGTIDAIEVWRPYIDRFHLLDRYDDVYEQDVREWRMQHFEGYDVVIFGDVLEHMSAEDAVRVWNRAMIAPMRVLSIPIIHYPQGDLNNNPYEIHVDAHWSHDRVLEAFTGITDSWQGTIEGAYIADRRAPEVRA
jgi:hypothetical protein